jgi:hypothetical protein
MQHMQGSVLIKKKWTEPTDSYCNRMRAHMDKSKRGHIFSLPGVSILLATVASANTHASVIYTSRTSSITAIVCDSGGANCSTQQVTDTSFDSFSQSVGNQSSSGYASQQSQLGQSGIAVTMFASQYGYTQNASSSFAVSFTVDTPMSFTFGGRDFYQLNEGTAQITSNLPCSYPVYYCSSEQQQGNTVDDTVGSPGILQPGAYTLFVKAIADGPPYMGNDPPTSGATVNLSLAPVPLPPSGILLGAGLGALLLLRFRAQRA